MSRTLQHQTDRFYRLVGELVRRYQFRDREGACCHGLSVSQCYSLEAIYVHGAMAMTELAAELGLELSTVTRVVNALVSVRLVLRVNDTTDRRVCRVDLTQKGRALVARIHGKLVQAHADVLREVPPASREAVISAVARLLAVCAPRRQQPSPGRRTSHGSRPKGDGAVARGFII